jgi:site-specific DNA-methyltransferase (adenine-specific)
MASIPAGSVDLVLADLPYGVTDCKWDHRISMAPLWRQYLRVLKDDGVIALFAQQPFATDLVNACRGLYRYEWIWDKGVCTGFANARRMPLRRHENVLVFYRRLPLYLPQGLKPLARKRVCRPKVSECYQRVGRTDYVQEWTGYPQSILQFRRERVSAPCQKPLALLQYLIRTYTKEGQTVLDNAMGTGSTGVAAVHEGRKFIGFEIDAERFAVAQQRIHAATQQTTMPAQEPARRRCGQHSSHGRAKVRRTTRAAEGVCIERPVRRERT